MPPSENELLDQVQEVFRAVLNLPALTLTCTTTASDVSGWDSLKHLELIIGIEERFGVRFKTVEVGALRDIGDLIDKVRDKQAAKARR